MTALTLAEALAELSELIPNRLTLIQMDWGEKWWAIKEADDVTGWVSIGYGEVAPARLEYMLREECEARGWNWAVSRQGRNPDGSWQYWGRIWHSRKNSPEATEMADTPVLALLLALLAALKAEGGKS